MLLAAPHMREVNERMNRIVTLRDKISLLKNQIFLLNATHQDSSEISLELHTLEQELFCLENHHVMNSFSVHH